MQLIKLEQRASSPVRDPGASHERFTIWQVILRLSSWKQRESAKCKVSWGKRVLDFHSKFQRRLTRSDSMFYCFRVYIRWQLGNFENQINIANKSFVSSSRFSPRGLWKDFVLLSSREIQTKNRSAIKSVAPWTVSKQNHFSDLRFFLSWKNLNFARARNGFWIFSEKVQLKFVVGKLINVLIASKKFLTTNRIIQKVVLLFIFKKIFVVNLWIRSVIFPIPGFKLQKKMVENNYKCH